MTRHFPLRIGSTVAALAACGCTHSWVVAGRGPAPKVSATAVEAAQQITVELQHPAYVFAYEWQGGVLRVAYRGADRVHRFVVAASSPLNSATLPAVPARRMVYVCPSGILNEQGVEATGKGCGWFLWPSGERSSLSLEPEPELSSSRAISVQRSVTTYLVVAERDIAPVELERAARSVDVRADPTAVGRTLALNLFGPDADAGMVLYAAFP